MDDKKLWNKMKSGDKEAFASIYQSEVNSLLKYGLKITKSVQLIEDAIQDLFIEIWQKRDRLSETDHIRKYLLVSFRRKLIHNIQKTEKKYFSEELGEGEYVNEDSPEDMWIDFEDFSAKKELLEVAVKQLSQRQKEIIHLKYGEGLDYPEISEMMGISYQSSRNLLTGALKKLKEFLPVVIFFLFSWVQKHLF